VSVNKNILAFTDRFILERDPSGEPSYVFSMLSLKPKPRELRSSGFHLFSVPGVKTHTGTRAFSVLSLLFGIHSLNM